MLQRANIWVWGMSFMWIRKQEHLSAFQHYRMSILNFPFQVVAEVGKRVLVAGAVA